MIRDELLASIKDTLLRMGTELDDGKNGACSLLVSRLEQETAELITLYEALRTDYESELAVRRDLETELAERKMFLESIFNNFDLAVFIMRVTSEEAFIFESINPTHEKLTGLRNDAIAGKQASEFLPAELAEAVERNYRRCLEKAATIEYEEMIPFEGRETWWMTRLTPLMDDDGRVERIIGSSTHISRLKRAEQTASSYASFIATLMDTLPVPVFYKDRNLKYIGCNRAFEQFLGRDKMQIIGKSVYELSPGEFAEEYDRQDRELLESRATQRYQSRVANADGLVREVVFTKEVFYDADGNVSGIVGTIADITERIAAEEILKDLSLKDELTGLYNRRGINQILPAEFSRSVSAGLPITIVMIDIDHFKKYNDRYGHQAGDRCLHDVAAAIQSSLVRTDDRAGRYGGEEFIVILSNTDQDGAMVVANRIKAAVARLAIPHENNAAAPIVTVSIGYSVRRPLPGDNADSLVHEADRWLYEAKHHGRNRIEGCCREL